MEISSLRIHLDRNPKFESRLSINSIQSSREDRAGLEQAFTNKIYVLPKITAAAFTAALDSAVDSLIVLGNIMDLPKVAVDMEYKSISNKYSEPYRMHIYNHETLETREEALEQERKLKFHKDRWVLKTLECLKIVFICRYIL